MLILMLISALCRHNKTLKYVRGKQRTWELTSFENDLDLYIGVGLYYDIDE